MLTSVPALDKHLEDGWADVTYQMLSHSSYSFKYSNRWGTWFILQNAVRAGSFRDLRHWPWPSTSALALTLLPHHRLGCLRCVYRSPCRHSCALRWNQPAVIVGSSFWLWLHCLDFSAACELRTSGPRNLVRLFSISLWQLAYYNKKLNKFSREIAIGTS